MIGTKTMSETLMQTSQGAMLLGDTKAAEGQNIRTPEEKALFWEALRERVNTIGGRAALDEAMNQIQTNTNQ